MLEFEKLLTKVAMRLDDERIGYMIIGGQAVLIHGEPRFTRDIDITLGIDVDMADAIFVIVRKLGMRPTKASTMNFVRRNALLTAEDPKTRIGVDFIFSNLQYERQAIERAKPILLGKAKVRFATAEDTIIHKLFAGRELDIADVKSIIRNTRKLDKRYLRKWLKDFSEVTGRDLIREFKMLEKQVKG